MMFTCDAHMCVVGVIAHILTPKLIPMVMVVRSLNFEDGDTSSFQRKEYLTVFCISQDNYSWPVTFTCTT